VQNVCPTCRTEYGPEQDVCPRDGAPLSAAAPPPATDPLLGQILADRYRVLRSIGEGGMGRVYLAEHVKMGRKSAVKVMSPALAPTPEAISRFNREAANASQIHQPNVAAIYDFGETADGTLYLAMEYVEGETLTALVQREGPLNPRRAAELTAQIADGLSAAHHLGIVHRDLKPDNILVTHQADGREWVKIVDFGIAKTTKDLGQNVTSIGTAIGTPDYMSPEQLAGETLDARTDVYSLGLVLFNMLTGSLPHPTMTSKQSLVQRLTAKPRALAEVRPNAAWSPRLQKALDRALAPEPDDRYATVQDLAREVRGAAGMAMPVGSLSAGAMAPSQAVTKMMTPLMAMAVPATRSARQPSKGGGGKGAVLVVVLLLMAGSTLVAMNPPRSLDAFLRANGVQLPSTARKSGADHPDSLAAAHGQSTAALAHDAADSTVHPSVPDSLSPIDAGLRLQSAAMRAGLRGDSSTGGDAVMQTAEMDAKEIMNHVNRARELTRQAQLKGAGLELRTSYEEYRIFLTEHASAPQTESLRKELQSAMDEALNTCYAARDSAVVKGAHPFRCEHPAKTGILVVEEDEPPKTP
jgi:serine/threonine-protein kinase